MRFAEACEKDFAKHETFHPRFGWLKKAHDGAANNPSIFNEEEAVVELGVGKNMVKSMRFWGTAFKILASIPHDGSRQQLLAPSQLGHLLFRKDDGWDPFSELPGTLWVLHWSLLSPKSRVPVWWLAMNEFSAIEFTAEELEQFVAERSADFTPTPSAIKKDVQCFLRMYSSGQSQRATFDDVIDCPFRDLALIAPSPADPSSFRFSVGAKPTLPPEVAAFACLDFIARTTPLAKTVNLSRLSSSEPGSPGRAFKLSEAALEALLGQAAQQHDDIVQLSSSAGITQLIFKDDPARCATDLLHAYYKRNKSHSTSPFAAGPFADSAVEICQPAGSQR